MRVPPVKWCANSWPNVLLERIFTGNLSSLSVNASPAPPYPAFVARTDSRSDSHERLAALRKERGLTQQALADRVDRQTGRGAQSSRTVWTDQAKADVRGIEQPVAIQILKTLGCYVPTGEGATKHLKCVTPPLIRLRAQNHRVFFREQDDHFQIERVLDRKEAYR